MVSFLDQQFEYAGRISDGYRRRAASLLTREGFTGAAGVAGGDVANYYGLASGGATNATDPFGLMSSGNSARQYRAAMRDHQFAAIRPLAVKVAEQSVRVGAKKSAGSARKLSSDQIYAKELRIEREKRLAPPFIVKELSSDGIDVIESHPIIDLFESPNPYLTKWALLYLTAYSMEAVGEAVWWVDLEGESRSIWYWPRNWIQPVTVNGVAFAKWKLTLPGLPADFPLIDGADIINFRYPNPADPTLPHSPTQSQSRAINTDDHIQDAQLASMKNSIRPSLGVVIGDVMPHPSGGQTRPELTPEQRKQILESIRLAYRGAMHTGDPIILDGLIADLKQIFPSAAELDFPNGSQLTKDRIYQGYGTNPIVAGQIEGANRASSAVAHDGFYALKVNPLLTLISEELTRKIGPRFTDGGQRLSVWLTQAEAKDADLKLRQVTTLAAQGMIRPSEARGQFGLPPDAELDALWLKQQQNKSLPPPQPAGPAAGPPRVKKKSVEFELLTKYDPSQPRDVSGKWTDGTGSSLPSVASAAKSGSHYDNPVTEESLTADEVSAVKSYTFGGYKDLNENLRNGTELTEGQQKLKRDLDSVIDKSGEVQNKSVLYRGVRTSDYLNESDGHDNAAAKFEKLIGQELSMPGFQSCSLVPEPALDAAKSRRNPGILFEVSTTKGAYLHKLSKYDDEHEVLLGHNWKYKVTGVTRNKKIETLDDRLDISMHVVHLEVL